MHRGFPTVIFLPDVWWVLVWDTSACSGMRYVCVCFCVHVFWNEVCVGVRSGMSYACPSMRCACVCVCSGMRRVCVCLCLYVFWYEVSVCVIWYEAYVLVCVFWNSFKQQAWENNHTPNSFKECLCYRQSILTRFMRTRSCTRTSSPAFPCGCTDPWPTPSIRAVIIFHSQTQVINIPRTSTACGVVLTKIGSEGIH